MAYRVASTTVKLRRGRPTPDGELHAYLDGRGESVCGRAIGVDLTAFNGVRWSARPLGLAICKICALTAR